MKLTFLAACAVGAVLGALLIRLGTALLDRIEDALAHP